jgi:hypothetical protein
VPTGGMRRAKSTLLITSATARSPNRIAYDEVMSKYQSHHGGTQVPEI